MYRALPLICFVGCSPTPDAPTAPTQVEPSEASDPLREAVDSTSRPDDERARDAARHPYETLTFFEISPDDRVLELWAGGGWYTHILAPYLASEGHLYVTEYAEDAEPAYRGEAAVKMKAWIAERGLADSVTILTVDADTPVFAVDEPVDTVLTFRNIHNWVKADTDRAIYEQAFAALKPGGIFGVVEHRAVDGTSREQSAVSGYMDQHQVIADITAVGFEFVNADEINANPFDTKDHPEGVWTLPPSLRLGEVDREKYVAIGESDRMTLKFRKPASDVPAQ